MTLAFLLSLGFAGAAGLAALAGVTPAITRLRQRRARALKRLEEGGNVGAQQAGPKLRREGAPGAEERGARGAGLFAIAGAAGGGLALPAFSWGAVLQVTAVGLSGAFVLKLVLGLPFIGGLPLALLAALLAGVLLRRMRQARRRKQIADRMPEALEMIVRALRVGQPVSAALKHTGERLPGPLGEELRLTSEKISFGQDISGALYALAERTGNTDLRFLAATVSIQIVTGGNLAEVLDRLAGITRARQQLARKISAITAEAKWSGRFLSGFPILAIAGVWFVDNNYFDSLVESDAFTPVCIVVATLLVLNVLFMRWLGQID